jgi:hypothetical protein
MGAGGGRGLLAGLGLAGAARAALPGAWGSRWCRARPGRRSPGPGRKVWRPRRQTASAGSPGQEIVRFPGIGINGGVVHATAVTGQFAWCQAQKWGSSGGT